MRSRTLICAFLFLALCALQLCRPNTAEAVRTCIEPAIAQDIPLRADAEALGRAIAGGGDVQAVWARWMDERGSAAQQTDVVTLNAELLEVVTEGNRHVASVHFSGMIREVAGAAAVPFDEVWNLAKPVSGDKGWVIAGIQQVS